MKRLVLALAGLLLAAPAHADEPQGTSATHILNLNDNDALIALKAMALAGDNHSKLLAEAWLVLSSIALGEGRQRCGLPDEAAKTMWQPALDGLTRDEIYELNRVVTSNFRNAETGTTLEKRKLFPVSRQAVILLSDRSGNWDCKTIQDVRERSTVYMRGRSPK